MQCSTPVPIYSNLGLFHMRIEANFICKVHKLEFDVTVFFKTSPEFPFQRTNYVNQALA